jgi:uncharacterized protein YndB with AHSA1/START domain
MSKRIDSASRLINAPPDAIYHAFSEPGSMEQWLPPHEMTGTMLEFDFQEGGHYKMRLTYKAPQGRPGKTSVDSDEVVVHLRKLVPGKCIEQEGDFKSDDPAFAGTMRMIWTFEPKEERTCVTIRAKNVPVGISQHDHLAGLNASLENLAAYVERQCN